MDIGSDAVGPLRGAIEALDGLDEILGAERLRVLGVYYSKDWDGSAAHVAGNLDGLNYAQRQAQELRQALAERLRQEAR